jgi:DNA helicase-2/ATP-dependent DNA helicase PcrA
MLHSSTTGGLNQQQVEAVETKDGPVLVLAGAGSGKTRVITHRIVHLIQGGARPEQVLAVTFTNKAAGEMKSRVTQMLNGQRLTGWPLLSTFHSLCVRILRRDIEAAKAGFTRNFTIYDDDDQVRVVRGIRKEIGLDDKSLTERQIQSSISWAKSRSITPAGYAKLGDQPSERNEKIARIYKAYQEKLKQANALDFDDLLIRTVDLLTKAPEVRSKYHERYRHVMIDEFQDTNGIQYELARLIVTNSTSHDRGAPDEKELWSDRSLFVVGDIDQSVYSWRGSDFNIILGFQHDFAGTKIIRLEQNYRSTQTILDAANRIIENNSRRLPKTLYCCDAAGQGERIRYYQSYDGEGEAMWVAEKIEEHLRRSPAARCAVLYRANSQSRLFEESLRRRGIEYNIVGGFSFYERAEVKDLIAYLKLSLNPDDDVALLRVVNSPPRGIGKTTQETLMSKQRDLGVSLWATIEEIAQARLLPPRAARALDVFREIIIGLHRRVESGEGLADLVKASSVDTGYIKALKEEDSKEAEGRLMNIEELVNAAAEAERQRESLRDFIDHAALVSDTDQYRSDARVTLMTMHSAKGLEFPVVFIVGLEEGVFPHSRSYESEADLEEERRLCYVAITRAQKNLYISHAMKRRTFGEESGTEPSRFLNELPGELIEDVSPGPSWLKFRGLPGEYSTRVGKSVEHQPQRAGSARGSFNSSTSGREVTGRGAFNRSKNNTNYTGKTYNSAEGVREFLANRASTGRSTGSQGTNKDDSPGAYKVGSRVRHDRYGQGVVLDCEGIGDDAKITVSFPGYGRKKFIAKYAGLEKVAR